MLRFGLLVTVLFAGSAVADDWPMGGRSTTRNPVSPEKNPPTDWTFPSDDAKPRNVKWSSRVGVGYRAMGGPVVSGGLIWVGTVDYDPDQKLDNPVLACFRESDGKLLYKYISPRLPKFPDDCPVKA